LTELPKDKVVHSLSYQALPVVGVVEVDQGRAGAGVAHAGHQLAQARPGGRGQDVAGVPQIVEVDVWQTCLRERGQPDLAPEVAAAQLPAGGAGEDQAVVAGLGVQIDVAAQAGDDQRRELNGTAPCGGLGGPMASLPSSVSVSEATMRTVPPGRSMLARVSAASSP
jgi:hypothetical protein